MDEYISKGNAIFAVSALPLTLDAETTQRAIEAVRHVPAADVVEVVRCKDCFYWSCGPDGAIWKCNMLSRGEYSVFTSEDAYCCWGRWKEA